MICWTHWFCFLADIFFCSLLHLGLQCHSIFVLSARQVQHLKALDSSVQKKSFGIFWKALLKTHFSSFKRSLFSSSWHSFVFANCLSPTWLDVHCTLAGKWSADAGSHQWHTGSENRYVHGSKLSTRHCTPDVRFPACHEISIWPRFWGQASAILQYKVVHDSGSAFSRVFEIPRSASLFWSWLFQASWRAHLQEVHASTGDGLGYRPNTPAQRAAACESLGRNVSGWTLGSNSGVPELSDDGLESVSKVTLKIQVAEKFLQDEVMWRDQENKSLKLPMMRPILEKHKNRGKKGKGKGQLREKLIKYEDLQGREIQIRKPYMVSLYMQVQYAHEIHPELPNPEDNALLRQFFDKCRKGMHFLLERLCRLPLGPHQEKWMTVPQEDAFGGHT